MPQLPNKKTHSSGPLVIFILLVILLGTALYTFKDTLIPLWKNLPGISSLIENPTPTPTPRPVKAIPKGSQDVLFSHGDKVVGPKISTATINPMDPKKGDTQTLTVAISHTSPVTSASVMLYTDNAKTPYTLSLKDGTTTKGTWEGSWMINDTYNYTYVFDFTLKSATGDYRGAITVRNDDGKL